MLFWINASQCTVFTICVTIMLASTLRDIYVFWYKITLVIKDFTIFWHWWVFGTFSCFLFFLTVFATFHLFFYFLNFLELVGTLVPNTCLNFWQLKLWGKSSCGVLKPLLVADLLLLVLVALVVMFKRGGLVQVHLPMVTTVMTMVSLLVERFKRGVATYYCSCISSNVPRPTLTTTSAAKRRWRGPMMMTINGGSKGDGGGNPSPLCTKIPWSWWWCWYVDCNGASGDGSDGGGDV